MPSLWSSVKTELTELTKISTIWLISESVTINVGEKAIVLDSERGRTINPFSKALRAIRAATFTLRSKGVSGELFFTNSTAANKPKPRMSPTNSWCCNLDFN